MEADDDPARLAEALEREPARPGLWRRLLDAWGRAGRLEAAAVLVRDALARVEPAAGPGARSPLELGLYDALYGAGFGLGDPVFQYPARVGRVAMSRDGARVAVGLERYGIHLLEAVGAPGARTLRGVRLHLAPRFVDLMAFTPDGARLVAAAFPEPEAQEADARLWLAVAGPGDGPVVEYRVAFDPPDPVRPEFRVMGASRDLRRLFAVGSDRSLTVVDLDPAAPPARVPVRRIPLPEVPGLLRSMVVHPAGSHALLGYSRTGEHGPVDRDHVLVEVAGARATRLAGVEGDPVVWGFSPARGELVGHWEDPYHNPADFSYSVPDRVVRRYPLAGDGEPVRELLRDPPTDLVTDPVSRPGYAYGDGQAGDDRAYPLHLEGGEAGVAVRVADHRADLAPVEARALGERPRLHAGPILGIRATATGDRIFTWSAGDMALWSGTQRRLLAAVARRKLEGSSLTGELGPACSGTGRFALHAPPQPAPSGVGRGPRLFDLFDLEAGRSWVLEAPAVDPYWMRALALAPDGGSLAVGMWDGDVVVLVPAAPFETHPAGARIRLEAAARFKPLPKGVHMLAFDRVDPGLLWAGDRGSGEIVRVSVRGGGRRAWPIWAKLGYLDLTHVPHPAAGLFGWGPKGACAYPREGGAMRLLGPAREEVRGACLTPDGTRLALASATDRVELFRLDPAGAAAPVLLDSFRTGAPCGSLEFGPGGELNYVQGHHVRIRAPA